MDCNHDLLSRSTTGLLTFCGNGLRHEQDDISRVGSPLQAAQKGAGHGG